MLPFGPTASAFAEFEVTPNGRPSAVGPLTASALLPIVAPAIATEAAEAAPRDGVVNDGETVIATLPVPEIEYSPTIPELSNSTRVFTPP